MRWIVTLPILLGACASWPTGSYDANISQQEASVLAPAIANYVAGAVPAGTPVSVEPARSGSSIGPQLAATLDKDGIPQDPTGRRVQYIAQPLDSGVMLRVSIDNREGGSQYFARSGGSLQPNGPMMVALP